MVSEWANDKDIVDNVECNETCGNFRVYTIVPSAVLLPLTVLVSTPVAFMIFIIILHKMYKYFFERLILYTAIAIMLQQTVAFTNDIVLLMNATNIITDNTQNATYCAIVGFGQQITLWWLMMSIFFISVAILVQVVFKWSIGIKCEVIILLFIFLFPLSLNWIPFHKSYYGNKSFSNICWIIIDKNETNHRLDMHGVGLAIGLYYAPFTIILVTIFVFFIITLITIKRRKSTWVINDTDNTQKMYSQLQHEVGTLMAFPIITVICNGIIFLINSAFLAVYLTNNDKICVPKSLKFILIIIGVAIFRSQGLLMALVFLCQPDIRQLLKWTNMKAAFRRYCHYDKKRRKVVSYAMQEAKSDSRLLDNSGLG